MKEPTAILGLEGFLTAEDAVPDRAHESIDLFIRSIAAFPRRHSTLLVGIDGCTAAGQRTFSSLIRQRRPELTLVPMSDFYVATGQRHLTADLIGADYDWQRLLDEVLEPLSKDQPARYRRYDSAVDTFADDWVYIQVGGLVLIEGTYSTRLELAQYYDLKIWIDCPHYMRLRQAIENDGNTSGDRWSKEWVPMEDRYILMHKPYTYADLIVDGSAVGAHR